jgi:ATP-dependent helicase/nuclease subunit A
MSFTPHQLRALATGHHVAVTANAGSGKTRVLVERYFRLVAGGAPLSEVLALTYTEKAAGELKRKIAGRISAALGEAGGEFPRTRLEEIRNGFATAFIGTIHSFCARLLREFPVEAGVDASFSVMEEIDSAAMIAGAVHEALASVMAGEMAAADVTREDLLTLVRALGKGRTRDFLALLVRRRDLRARMERTAYAGGDDAVLGRWREELEKTLEGAMADPELLADMETVIGGASGKERPAVEEAFGVMRTPGALRVRASAFLRAGEGMLTKDGSLRRSLVTKEDGEDPRVTTAGLRLKGKLSDGAPLAEFIVSGAPDGVHRPLLHAGRLLLALASDATLRYGTQKEEEGRLDFEDLQLVMRDLLANEGVRAQLLRRFRYVMVDEFQDTNALQLDILLPLLDRLQAGNLFVVGDPKQSIYRFREADVRVFRKTTSDITSAAGTPGEVKLGESFRPLRDIAAFVNLLFAPLMTGGYEPLVIARKNDTPGVVEFLLADPAGEEGLTEEELVVRRLLALVEEGRTVFDAPEVPRRVRFGDIAILLRNRNALPRFEEALIRGGVPYAVSGGVGYFQTQDVYDTYNYLRFLVDPADDVALAGILRSPYFNVSDADLFRLSERHGGESLWSALRGAEALRAASGPLDRAGRILEGDRGAGVRLPVPELLVRIIGRSLLPGALSGTPRGAQAMANLEKLIAMARQFEGQGFNGLYDFVARLRHLMDEEEREGQATIDSRADAVRVMTVHASKGLEFPVVVVPRLHAPFGRDREPFLDEDLGLGFRLGKEELPPIAERMREREREKQREEEERVFYVACTRARDILILSAEEARASGDSWLGWLREALGPGGVEGELIVRSVESAWYDPARGGEHREAHSLSIPILRSLPPLPAPDASLPLQRDGMRVDLGRLSSSPHGEIFSASKVRTYIECPAKYYFRYVLGYPLGMGPFAGGDEEEMADGDYPAELRGRIFHSVMEKADLLDPSGPSVEEEVTAVLARQLPGARGGTLAADVAALVRGILSSAAWSEVARGTEVRTEFSISAALGGDFITGTIDRLYRDDDGVWTIVDYKTDAVSAAAAGARADLYWPQLAFYGVMVERLHDARRVRARILFAAHPELRLIREFDLSALQDASREIESVIENIRAQNFPGRPLACRGCPLAPRKCGHSQLGSSLPGAPH